MTRVGGVAVISAVCFSLAISVSAVAEERLPRTLEILENASAISTTPATDVLNDVAQSDTSIGTTLAYDEIVNGVQIQIPVKADSPISLETTAGNGIDVRLPFNEHASSAETLSSGVVSFDHENDSISVPIVKDDGSLQITTIIESSVAPSSYLYEVSLPAGGRIEQLQNGALVLLDREGAFLAGIGAPWAKDATGADVLTHFVVDGNLITQVVEHTRQPVTYPVVADPWLGVNLFARIWYDTYNGDLRVNVQKSAWGQYIHTPGPGQTIFWTAGWDELRTRAPRVLEKETLHQQYDCHVGGGFLDVAGPEWNLEKFRWNRTVDWTYGVAVHHCNWKTPNGV